MIVNILGQPGSGKTTIAKILTERLTNSINLDGDELRELFINKDYTEIGRRNNIQNAYNIARFLDSKGFTPVLSLVSPFKDLRENLKTTNEVIEVFLKTSAIRGREKFHVLEFEIPTENFIEFDTTGKNPSEIANSILESIRPF